MSSTKREWLLQVATSTAIALIVGIFIGLLGPFGTYSSPLPNRLAYWVAVIGINWLLCALTLRQIERLFPSDRHYAILAVPLFTSLLLTVPATAVVFFIGSLTGLAHPDIVSLLGMVLLLLVILTIPAHIIKRLIRQRRESRLETRVAVEPATIPDNDSTFFARFSPPIRGPITSIESQDHYLVVRGPDDQRMIHGRMSDAERELGALGTRVHRSWWVAGDAIRGRLNRNGRRYLELTDGQLVPVSRSYRSALDDPNLT
jgi:hypothetical protein